MAHRTDVARWIQEVNAGNSMGGVDHLRQQTVHGHRGWLSSGDSSADRLGKASAKMRRSFQVPRGFQHFQDDEALEVSSARFYLTDSNAGFSNVMLV